MPDSISLLFAECFALLPLQRKPDQMKHGHVAEAQHIEPFCHMAGGMVRLGTLGWGGATYITQNDHRIALLF